VTIKEVSMFYCPYIVWTLERKHRSTAIQHAAGNHGDEGWDSKVGEDAVSKCFFSNTFNAIVETN
jgi:hypothetical protein